MKVYDEYLQKEVEVQEEITPEIGREIKIEDPEEFKDIINRSEQ